ncbi:hypothetical protein V1264_015266 [Littorina saxatilis]
MDNQKTECGGARDGDDGEKEPSSSQHADDRTNSDPSYVRETLGSDQPHTTEDQDETVDVKMDVKSLCQPGDAAKTFDQMDLSLLRSPSLRTDPMQQFANSAIVSGSENRNTHRKTGADMRILATYMRSLNEMRAPETIPPTDLDKYLSSFFLVVRKTDGSEYEPCSLRAMLASIERYLRQKNYPSSLTRDSEFSNMRNVLKLKQQMLRSLGKGQKTIAEVPQTACIREGKITRLFQSHEMGPYNPNSVIFSLCFFFCMYLKLRKSTEHKKLLWGDIILCQDYNNREYLTFSPQMLSRIHASQRLNHRLANARVWAEPDVPERDPVALYKFYAQKRPLSMTQPYAPFYLGLNLVNPLAGQSWYRPAAMGINKLNEMVRQIRDLTGLKASNDTSPLQYLAPSGAQDMLPLMSEFSNASSDPSSSRDGHNLDTSDFDGREITPNGSPQLTIDVDEGGGEAVSASTSFDQPLSLTRESDSSDEHSMKSPSTGRHLDKSEASPSFSTVTGHADEGDVFQHQVATMNVAKARELLAQSSELAFSDDDDDDDPDDFIGVEQAKELLTDIIQRMDIKDMMVFDRWLKCMTIARDSFSGQIVCKDPKRGSATNAHRHSTFNNNDETNNESSANENTNMNILLNISLTPTAMRGQGPVTVQATTISASDLSAMSAFPSQQSDVHTSGNGAEYCNGSSDSPLDLALSSMRGGSSSASDSHRTSRVSSSSGVNYKHSASSAAGPECSPAKQRRPPYNSVYNHHQPAYSRAAANHSAAAAVVSGVRRSSGQYEGSRRKLNPAFLTHIKPRVSDSDTGGRTGRLLMSSTAELDENVTLAHSNSVDDEDLVHVLNLKQEVE